MRALVPGARLLAILRDPVSRAYSHYWWRRIWGVEDADFAGAIRPESVHGADGWPGYLALGRYREQLQRLGEQFPRRQTLVLLFDEWVTGPASTFRRLCSHIGIEEWVPPHVGRQVNSTGRLRVPWLWNRMARWRGRTEGRYWLARRIDGWNVVPFRPPRMDPAIRELLADYFREPKDELARWLGRDLGSWR